jgi:hypothetical protein
MLPCTSAPLYTHCLCHHAHYCVGICVLFSICTKYITIVMILLHSAYECCSCPHHVRDRLKSNVEILSVIIREYKVPVGSRDLFENLVAGPTVFHQQLLYNSACTIYKQQNFQSIWASIFVHEHQLYILRMKREKATPVEWHECLWCICKVMLLSDYIVPDHPSTTRNIGWERHKMRRLFKRANLTTVNISTVENVCRFWLDWVFPA